MARTLLAILITVVAVALVGVLIYFPQMAQTPAPRPSPKVVQVIIPESASLPPEGWKGGYVFSDKYYAPSNLTINVGDVVEWINKDSLAHTVTFHKLPAGVKEIDSGVLAAGKSWQFTFNIPGEYE